MSDDPSPNPERSSDGETQDNFPSIEEFAQWLKEDPANMEKHCQHLERAVAGELGELPAELLTAARATLATRRQEKLAQLIREKLEGINALLGQSVGSMRADELLAQCQALMDEVTDALLDVPEPNRTQLFQQFLPIREMFARLKAK
jgi:hypothetical protein